MKLKPVQNYTGAKYPCLADYLSDCRRGRKLSGLKLAVALTLLSALLAGCAPSNAS